MKGKVGVFCEKNGDVRGWREEGMKRQMGERG